jgi:hypothetical protein
MNTQRRTSGPAVSDLYIRVHMPLRVNPVNGCPLLPLTVVDHMRAERLVKEGRVDQRREERLFMEHILGPVSATDLNLLLGVSLGVYIVWVGLCARECIMLCLPQTVP